MKKDCNEITREIWLFYLDKKMTITAVHIPDVDNTKADEASRQKGLETEWSLESKVFYDIEKI